MSSNKPENQPLLELDKNKAASPTESSGGNEVDSLEKVGNERNIAQLGKITLTAGVACLHMASTMGLITVGRKQDWGTGAKHTGGERNKEIRVRCIFRRSNASCSESRDASDTIPSPRPLSTLHTAEQSLDQRFGL